MSDWTNGDWDNTRPDGDRDPTLGDDDIVEFKKQVEERLSPMVTGFSASEQDKALLGFKTAIFRPQDPSPAVIANAIQLYAKDVGGKPRLHTRDEDNAEVEYMPYGAIIMWSGAMADIPTGWNLCDGQDGRPDMLDRFVKCVASGAGVPGTLGGATTHVHTGPSHTHTSAVHTHVVPYSGWTGDFNAPYVSGVLQLDNPGNIAHATANRTSGATTPGVTGAGGTNNTGAGSSNPAYFEVAFIINS